MGSASQVIRVKSHQNETTTLWVYAIYTASFCEHLKTKGVKYTMSDIAMTEPGYDKGLTFRKYVWHEVVIRYTGDIGKLLSDWSIPPAGL